MKDLRRLFLRRKKILILSPHPDDDSLGMGGTLYFLKKNNLLKILYLTPGWKGVRGKISKEGKKVLRKKEAIGANKILGINEDSLIFLSLPFYEKGKISNVDIKIITQEIKRFKPQFIFTCGKEDDPHRTHRKCWEIFKSCLKEIDFPLRVFIYRVWRNFKKFDFYFPFGEEIMDKKIEAIKAHKSQLSPKFTKNKIFSFWIREERLNRKYGERLNKGKFLFAEVFKTWPNNPE